MKIKREISYTSKNWKEASTEAAFFDRVGKTLSQDVIFTFPDGIPAFEEAERFVILLNESIKPFIYLKSLDIDDLGFVCIDPFLVCIEYSINIPAKDVSLLGLTDPSDALILSFVTIEADPQQTTANLLAPVIMNIKNNTGHQVILNEQYPVRYKIWEGIEKFEQTVV